MKKPLKLSRFARHKQFWESGCGANECGSSNVCLFRGDVPCHILFVGEAPGERENSLGVPFVGPAGKLLDRIVKNSVGIINEDRHEEGLFALKVGFTNIVGCMPTDESGDKISQPDIDQVDACSTRLVEIIQICKPLLIVCVGQLATEYLDQKMLYNSRFRKVPQGTRMISITHPAAILRANVPVQPIMEKKAISIIIQAIENLDRE